MTSFVFQNNGGFILIKGNALAKINFTKYGKPILQILLVGIEE
jgi:hypothetical protein